MAKKLWQTPKSKKLHPLVEEFASAEGVLLDQELVAYDIAGSVAHAKGLKKIGILTGDELNKIVGGLNKILKGYQKGSFKLKTSDEDVHTAVENKLVELIGEPGEKLHAGRSRNDQVLTDLKLFVKDKIKEVGKAGGELTKDFMVFGRKYKDVPLPGYTHMQKAMPSSVKLWGDNFASMLQDDLKILKAVDEVLDQNPLGSGAAYGVDLPGVSKPYAFLDRKLTTKLLGFAKVQENVLAAQNMRGKNELYVLQALGQVMITLSKFAQDVLLFTMTEFDFFEVPESLTTGSSIMPQKKNLDVMELVRAKTHTVLALAGRVGGIAAGLPSGYNGDLQETKGPLIQGLKVTLQSLRVCQLVVRGLKPRKEKLKAAMTEDLYATDKAYELVKQGMPFREAYRKVKEEYEK